MSVVEQMRDRLQTLAPRKIEIIDDSAKHA